MMYRYKDSAGQTVYQDRPPSASEAVSAVDVLSSGVLIKTEPAKQDPHAQAKGYIKDARKHIPKVLVYIEYIEYLRTTNPARYQAYLRQIMANDPKTHATLMRAGLFQPLKPYQRLSNMFDASVGAMGELFAGRSGAGAAASYAEKTLVDYMKKDRFMPDVLGAKASTLPKEVAHYSNTRLGQWSKMEDVKVANASKLLQTTLTSRPVLNAAATAATKVSGPVLDAMIWALDPQTAPGILATAGLDAYVKNLEAKGIILDGDEVLYLRGHLARKDWEAARNLVREAALRSGK